MESLSIPILLLYPYGPAMQTVQFVPQSGAQPLVAVYLCAPAHLVLVGG